MSEREVRELLDKARRSLRAAERLLDGNDQDFAISRAYYAMFYAAQALLLGRGIRRSKHAGVLAAFNEEFVRPGLLSPDLFLKFRDGFEDRAEGDYGLVIISDEQARAALSSAGDFVDAVARYIGSQAGPPAAGV